VLHEEEKTKRFTPACFASLASFTDARWLMVVGELGVEIAQWIIRQSSQVHDRVEAFQIRPDVDLAP
jgi:hypothetical protein